MVRSSQGSIRRAGFLWLYVPLPFSGEEVMLVGSAYPVRPGETVFVGAFVDARAGATHPMPPGTVVSMRFRAIDENGDAVAPGDGEFFRYTVMKGEAATLCEIELTGAQTQGKSNVPVSVEDMGQLNVRIQVSGGAPEASHNGSLRFAPDPDND
mgnify:CR=1 FL=1